MSQGLTNFLKKQNLMLKQENKELKTLLQLNREALKVSTQPRKGQANFLPLITLLYQENSKLHKKINQLTVELETGMCQALISEQIAFASTEQEKYLTNQLKDKLTRMRKELQSRQKKIIELTKGEVDKKILQNPQAKVIEVIDLSTITKKFKDQINQLRNQIEEKRQEVSKYKDQKQQLLKLNLILTKQINEYKLITSHQSTGSNELGSGDLSKFMSYQRKIIEDEDDPESDDDQFKNSSQSGEGFSSNDEPSIEEPTKISKISKLEVSKVPKLQLTKAKEIQQLIVQKINQDDNKKKGGVVKEEKFKKIEAEIAILRKKVGCAMLQKIQIEKQNNFLKRFVKELEGRNQALCELRKEDNELNTSAHYLNQNKEGQGDTETLLDICRDVTLNPILRKVLNGSIELPYNSKLFSYDI